MLCHVTIAFTTRNYVSWTSPIQSKHSIPLSLFLGQICLCPDYVLVPDSIKSALIAEMKKVLKQFHGENPANSDDYDGKIVNQKHTARLM